MKKTYFIFTFLILCKLATAQNFTGNFEIGLCAAQIDGDTWYGYDKAGPIVGFSVETHLNKNVSLIFGGRIINKGSKQKSNTKLGDPTGNKISLYYFEIPAYFNFRLKNRFAIQTGGTMGYLFRSRIYEYGELMSENDPMLYNKDLNLLFGLQYNYNEKWNFNMCWQYSMVSIRIENGWFNHALTFTVQRKLGKKNEE